MVTYKDAGHDLQANQQVVARIQQHLRRTHTPRVIDVPGGFAGLFSLDYDSRLFARNYRRPVLVPCSDGVGTKLKIAFLLDKHDTVGIDLVAMNVNDCLVTGAEPLLFVDYIAQGDDNPDRVEQIVAGISDGCIQANCALVGGETATMSGFYQPGEYDLAGFSVGVVERNRIIDGTTTQPDDAVIGLASNGIHSNGYSLVRKICFEMAGLDVQRHIPELNGTLGETLLRPTRIYVRPINRLLARYKVKKVVRSMAHITGGGLIENVPRSLPEGCGVEIRRGSWPVPPIFAFLQRHGEVEDGEMYRVFNMGIGFVIIASPYYASSIIRQLQRTGVEAWQIGRVVEGPRKVRLIG